MCELSAQAQDLFENGIQQIELFEKIKDNLRHDKNIKGRFISNAL